MRSTRHVCITSYTSSICHHTRGHTQLEADTTLSWQEGAGRGLAEGGGEAGGPWGGSGRWKRQMRQFAGRWPDPALGCFLRSGLGSFVGLGIPHPGAGFAAEAAGAPSTCWLEAASGVCAAPAFPEARASSFSSWAVPGASPGEPLSHTRPPSVCRRHVRLRKGLDS